MQSFKKNLQNFLVYFFAGTSVALVVLGLVRVKKGEQTTQVPSSPETGLSPFVETAFKGNTYQTPWGNLAVAIQVKDGKITAVTIPTLPDSPPSIQAKPYLIAEALKSGNSNIQSISGATITSLAFKASLESALARAASNTLTAVNTDVTGLKATTPPAVAPVVKAPASVTTKTATSGISGSFTGNAYQTPWGNAVASISVTNGKITDVTMPQVPNSPPSQYAEPYLIQQALATGSANIQGVSGATDTSLAFKSSLESAIAKANTQASTQGKATVTTSPTSGTAVTGPATSPAVPRKYRDDDEWDD